MDLPKRRRAWEAGGRRGRRPHRCLLPSVHDLRTVSFWVVVIQLAGMLVRIWNNRMGSLTCHTLVLFDRQRVCLCRNLKG